MLLFLHGDEVDSSYVIKIPIEYLDKEQKVFLRQHRGKYILKYVGERYGGYEGDRDRDPTGVIKMFISPYVMGGDLPKRSGVVCMDVCEAHTKKNERAEFLYFSIYE